MNKQSVYEAATDQTILAMQETIRSSDKIHICGARTKSGFHPLAEEATAISVQSLQGIVSYDPQEFVITVLAGTVVSDIVGILASQEQYLPFDPLLTKSRATIGGTVASNAAGSGRFRFGGIRDFLLGVRFIDGRGNCIRGGGQVVKNAAGFDYPKLMVGSQGKFGLIYELTFKVFPRPESYATQVSRFTKLDDALNCMSLLSSSAMDVEALDLIPVDGSSKEYDLAIRIGGISQAINSRLMRLQKVIPANRVMKGEEDYQFWQAVSHFEWACSTQTILKLPITPLAIPELEERMANSRIDRRYSVGGNVLWVASKKDSQWVDPNRPAQTFFGNSDAAELTLNPGPFGRAIQRAIDPDRKFV